MENNNQKQQQQQQQQQQPNDSDSNKTENLIIKTTETQVVTCTSTATIGITNTDTSASQLDVSEIEDKEANELSTHKLDQEATMKAIKSATTNHQWDLVIQHAAHMKRLQHTKDSKLHPPDDAEEGDSNQTQTQHDGETKESKKTTIITNNQELHIWGSKCLFVQLPNDIIANLMQYLSWRRWGFHRRRLLRWNADLHCLCVTCKLATDIVDEYLKLPNSMLNNVPMSQFPLTSVSGCSFGITNKSKDRFYNTKIDVRLYQNLNAFATLTTLASKTKWLLDNYGKTMSSGPQPWYNDTERGILFCIVDNTTSTVVAHAKVDYMYENDGGWHDSDCFRATERVRQVCPNTSPFDLSKTSKMTPEYAHENLSLTIFIDINGHRFVVSDVPKLPNKVERDGSGYSEVVDGPETWPLKWDVFYWPEDERYCYNTDSGMFVGYNYLLDNEYSDDYSPSISFTVDFYPRIHEPIPNWVVEEYSDLNPNNVMEAYEHTAHSNGHEVEETWEPHINIECQYGIEMLLSRAHQDKRY